MVSDTLSPEGVLYTAYQWKGQGVRLAPVLALVNHGVHQVHHDCMRLAKRRCGERDTFSELADVVASVKEL